MFDSNFSVADVINSANEGGQSFDRTENLKTWLEVGIGEQANVRFIGFGIPHVNEAMPPQAYLILNDNASVDGVGMYWSHRNRATNPKGESLTLNAWLYTREKHEADLHKVQDVFKQKAKMLVWVQLLEDFTTTIKWDNDGTTETEEYTYPKGCVRLYAVSRIQKSFGLEQQIKAVAEDEDLDFNPFAFKTKPYRIKVEQGQERSWRNFAKSAFRATAKDVGVLIPNELVANHDTKVKADGGYTEIDGSKPWHGTVAKEFMAQLKADEKINPFRPNEDRVLDKVNSIISTIKDGSFFKEDGDGQAEQIGVSEPKATTSAPKVDGDDLPF